MPLKDVVSEFVVGSRGFVIAGIVVPASFVYRGAEYLAKRVRRAAKRTVPLQRMIPLLRQFKRMCEPAAPAAS